MMARARRSGELVEVFAEESACEEAPIHVLSLPAAECYRKSAFSWNSVRELLAAGTTGDDPTRMDSPGDRLPLDTTPRSHKPHSPDLQNP